eukprot:maker-scaffold444_size168727-snap-gene-0.31 protein:Tk11363 transcript:maker-scaffold444_size168727-snap-gene-0.31-mRNA-1 annotation:"hypothetical protein"
MEEVSIEGEAFLDLTELILTIEGLRGLLPKGWHLFQARFTSGVHSQGMPFPAPPPPPPVDFKNAVESGPLIQPLLDQPSEHPSCGGRKYLSCYQAQINFNQLDQSPITLPDGTAMKAQFADQGLYPGEAYKSQSFSSESEDEYGTCTFTFSVAERYIIGDCVTKEGTYGISTCGTDCYLFVSYDPTVQYDF